MNETNIGGGLPAVIEAVEAPEVQVEASIFGTNAPLYWAADLSVIPLQIRDKKPAAGFTGWADKYCNRLASEEEQATWVDAYRFNNIGLACGIASGIVGVDIDTTDVALQKIILGTLPVGSSGWVRIGAKGMLLAFKLKGGNKSKVKLGVVGAKSWSLHLMGEAAGETKPILDFIGQGRQFVLPPSIHPDTGLEYKASGCLWSEEILEGLPELDGAEWKEKVRVAIVAAGYKVSGGASAAKISLATFVGKGSRDNTMIQIAGKMARTVIMGDATVLRCINDMYGWAETAVAKVDGDPLDIDKGVSAFLGFLVADVKERGCVLPLGWDEGLTVEMKEELGLSFDEKEDLVAEEWDLARIKKYIKDELSNDPDEAKKIEVTDFVVRKLSKARRKAYDALEIDGLIDYLKAATGSKLPRGTYKRAIMDIKSGPIAGENHTEIAEDAVIRWAERNGKLSFWAESFWRWGGLCWEKVLDRDLLAYIASEYGELPAARRANDHKGILSICQALLHVEHLGAGDGVEGINFKNGFLTIDGQLVGHDPGFGMTYVLDFDYLGEKGVSGCPKFIAFLERCWGRGSGTKIMALQEAIGVTMFGRATIFQKAFLLYGLGGTGKSQLMRIIEALMPKEAKSYISPYEFSDKFAPAQLAGKLINICAELDEHRFIEARTFKNIITADSELNAQHKNQQRFNFMPKCAHWFASNFLPRSRDTSDGFSRRWMIFMFDSVVTEEEKIADFGLRLVEEEREAIAAWAIQGYRRLVKAGKYTAFVESEALVGEMANSIDTIKGFAFTSGRLEFKEGEKVSEEMLYNAYFSWTVTHGETNRVPKRAFVRGIHNSLASKAVKVVVGSDGTRYFEGIRLKG